MSVKLVIKTPPASPGPQHSTYQGTPIYHGPAGATGPIGLSFIRNNRIIGYFSDAYQARANIDWLISRENEFGIDV